MTDDDARRGRPTPEDAREYASAGAGGPAAAERGTETAATEPPGGGAEQRAVSAPLPMPDRPAVPGVADGAADETVRAAHPLTAPARGRSGAGSALAPVTPTLTSRTLTSGRAPRVRASVAAFLVVASVLAVLVSALALWSWSVVFDSDAHVQVVAPVAEDPEVRAAVGEYVAARAVQAARLESRIESALPTDAELLAPALTASLERFLADEVEEFLGTELARRLWMDINRSAHEQFIAALRDENSTVTVGRSDVRLDLLPLVAVALQKLEDRIPQLLGRDVTLPEIDPGTAPGDMRILLQDALGRELPADFGSITLLEGSQGWEVKQALRTFDDLVVLVVVLTLVLIAAAVVVSVRRVRTALWLGIGALLAFVTARAIEVRLEDALTGSVAPSPAGAAVARSVLRSAVESLNGFVVWLAVAGAVVAVAAFLAGRPSWLESIGDGVARLFGAASDLSTPDTRAGRWMAAHLDVLRAAGVGVAVVALLFATASLTAVLLILLALVAYELALAVYGAGVPDAPEDQTPGEPPAPPAR